MNDIPMKVVRGTDYKISQKAINDGYLYWAYDSGKIYMDKGNDRILMGGSGTAAGASIYYGIYGQAIDQDAADKKYHYPKNSLEDEKDVPAIDDIILDYKGYMYRILEITEEEYLCSLLPLSGSGGGAFSVRPSLTIGTISNNIILNGQSFEVPFTVVSTLDDNDTPVDTEFTIYYSLIDSDSEMTYYTGTPFKADNNKETILTIFGTQLKDSTNTIIEIYARGNNHEEPSATRRVSVSTVKMYLKQDQNFKSSNTYNADSTVINCYAYGDLNKILEWKLDGEVLKTEYLNEKSIPLRTYSIPYDKATHGAHTITIELYQNLGTESLPVKNEATKDSLQYEIAIVRQGETMPIIWLGDYKTEYYNYDNIRIPFLVYNPTNTIQSEVSLYKNDIEIESSPWTITDFSDFTYWQIADAEVNKKNYYSISCGITATGIATRDIIFEVKEDPNRKDMIITKQSNLLLDFNPVGRTNNEPVGLRNKWIYYSNIKNKEFSGIFTNFNWYNNGWQIDKDTQETFLRISNGANFTIPFIELPFAGSASDEQSNSIEIIFKIRNIQKYNDLITNVTRYKNDSSYYNEYIAQTKYDNYDAYLQANLTADQYEALEFEKVQKNIDLSNIVCGLYSGNNSSVTGIGIGPQNTLFSNGQDTLSVDFVENKIIHLSFVYDHTLKLLLMYINGVVTGVIKSTKETSFSIDDINIAFNSDICDIDLYKIRIYNTALTVNDIVVNYAVDKKDVDIYDQSKMAEINQSLAEYQLKFNKVKEYNEEHIDKPLMPYIIFDTTNKADNKLPYSKKIEDMAIRVDFVNTPLDNAYAQGQLVELAVQDGLLTKGETDQGKIKEAVALYYKHHCPSWTSTLSTSDTVDISLQGTSSQFYPRRNFKVKAKIKETVFDADTGKTEENKYLNIFMNKGPYEETYKNDQNKRKEDSSYRGDEECRLSDGWYFNNYTNATDRWTLKVDYMESSGSYNAGFASMVGQAYTKHPLEDYVNSGAFNGAGALQSEVTNTINWKDYRTSMLGFPVMAFQKISNTGIDADDYLFIGYYRMLLDKGSSDVFGFSPSKKITQKYLNEKKVKDIAECWEFSNNARTFCSFRDPWNRVELSFSAPDSATIAERNIKLDGGGYGGPVVLNSFEPRYFWAEDYLKSDEPGLYTFGQTTKEDRAAMAEDLKEIYTELGFVADENGLVNEDDETQQGKNVEAVTNTLLKNWEKACAWVYSTNTDNVASGGKYSKATGIGDTEYTNGYYIMQDDGSYIQDISGEFNEEINYYKQENVEGVTTYTKIYLCKPENLYKSNKYYILIDNTYSLCSESAFDNSYTYYNFSALSDEELEEYANRLVTKATEYKENETYYTYNKDAKTGLKDDGKLVEPAVVKVDTTKVTINADNVSQFYVAASKTYTKEYKFDTKEYRAEKFKNELSEHFDIEYLSTYFVMTEVFECYDSRGKNCMMASWGPLKEGGDYIWYPIFYDIDTQLGINNTGIPSFKFNVDATIQGNYSTSDSVLWNNFYKFFKNTSILSKYKNLKGQKTSDYSTALPLLNDINTIEDWYNFNFSVTNNIADKGKRPIIATNLDMYFKYITITNKEAINQGVAYLDGTNGTPTIDSSGSYFYALQGDRDLSRQQFLTNRLEYIDSWLGQGDYARGGTNRIRGRISANDFLNENERAISDKWIETDDELYWKNNIEFGEKTHDFDAEYWFTLTPLRSSYVTAGDDNENYPSQKYNGLTPINYKLDALETGVRSRKNYPEQLVYLYGMNQMVELGNLYNLYWREFYLEGQANHLTQLLLGCDKPSSTDPGVNWYDKKLNGITLPVSLPLLKEMNLSNITFTAEQTRAINLSQSEKLENFRALNSNITAVQLAPGVAINTLYLPNTITSLRLESTNLLTRFLDSSTIPTTWENGIYTVPEGLFIQDFYDDSIDNGLSLTQLYIDKGAFGYDSYKILEKFYDKHKKLGDKAYLSFKDVNWSPYVQLAEGYTYNEDEQYYINDKHYSIKIWEDKNENAFDSLIANGQLYLKGDSKETDINMIDDKFIDILTDLMQDDSQFADATIADGKTKAIISGNVYINNNIEIDESSTIVKLQTNYPSLNMIFAPDKVRQAYSAEFVYLDDEGIEHYVDFKDGSKLDSIQKLSKEDGDSGLFFTSPFTLYEPKRTHYDFKGWCMNPIVTEQYPLIQAKDWTNLEVTNEQIDYKFYAIFEKHSYEVIFYNSDNKTPIETSKYYEYGTEGIKAPTTIPWKDASKEELTKTYIFLGYSDNIASNSIVNLENEIVRGKLEFYPVFKLGDVHDEENIHEEYFSIDPSTGFISWNTDYTYQGKLTIPFKINDIAVKGIPQNGFSSKLKNVTHIFWGRKNEEPDNDFDCLGTSHNYFYGGGCFAQLSNLCYFEMPSSVIAISPRCFNGCSKLFGTGLEDAEYYVKVFFANIQFIGTNSFTSTGLRKFELGENLTGMQTKAFYNISSSVESCTIKSSKLILAECGTQIFEQPNKKDFSLIFQSNQYNTDDWKNAFGNVTYSFPSA